MLILERPSAISRYVQIWRDNRPDFLWVPDSQHNLLRDQAKGVVGKVVGNRPLALGGLVNPVAASSTDWIEFPTNVGIVANNTKFIGVALVSIPDASSQRGAFLKIGSDANGLGYGFGNFSFDDSGSKLVLLRENISWNISSASALASGLNVLTFGSCTYGAGVGNFLTNMTASWAEAGVAAAGTQSIDARLRINGYVTSRGTASIVHALAIFRVDLSEAEYSAARTKLSNPQLALNRIPFPHARNLFNARRIHIPTAAAAAGVPTLSASTYVAGSLSSTGWRPQITAS